MSWLKFWGKKSGKKDDKKTRSDLVRSESFKDESGLQESEKDKNARLRHTMSISRSGRFKQKNKQRSGILDKPEFYNGTNGDHSDGQKENRENSAHPVSQLGTHFGNNDMKRTPPSTCRDVSSRQPITARHFEGQQTVLWWKHDKLCCCFVFSKKILVICFAMAVSLWISIYKDLLYICDGKCDISVLINLCGS